MAEKELKMESMWMRTSTLLLRPLEKSDGVNVCRWMSSPYILQHSFVVPGPKSVPSDFATYEYAHRYFELLLSDPRRLTFAIELEGVHIGTIGLKEICFRNLSAECFIEIGEAHLRGRGLGAQAMKKMLNHAFYGYGLMTVDLDVLEFNFAAIKIYHRLGFVMLGQSGWHYDEFGQYWRVLKMSLCKNAFAEGLSTYKGDTLF